MSNKNKFWDQAEDLIKSYNLKPKDFKTSDNWNKPGSIKALEKDLKAGVTSRSDDRTFRNDEGDLEVKVKDWMTKAAGQQVADETGAKMPTVNNQSSWAKGTKAGDAGGTLDKDTGLGHNKYGDWLDMGEGFRGKGWFGLDDLAQVNKWKGKDLLKSWLDKGDHRGLGGVEAIGKGVAADLWGYTNPGDSGDAFGKKDIEELRAAGATDEHIKKIRRGFSIRPEAVVGAWAKDDKNWVGGGPTIKPKTQTNTNTNTKPKTGGPNTSSSTPTGKPNPNKQNVPADPDPKFFSADSMQAGSGASGVAARRSKQHKWSLLAGQGTGQLSRKFKNLSLRIN